MKSKFFLSIILGLFLISLVSSASFGYNYLDSLQTGSTTNNYYNITGGNETTWIANYSSDTLFRNLNLTGNITATNGLHIFMPDNLEEAFTLQQGANNYIHAITLNGQEELHLGHDASDNDIMSLIYNNGLFKTKITGDLNVTRTNNGTSTFFINGSTGRIEMGNTLSIENTANIPIGINAYNPSTGSAASAQVSVRSGSATGVLSASNFYGTVTLQGLTGEKLALGANYGVGMTFDTTNKVGIGTTAPTTTLDVNGSILASGDVKAVGFLRAGNVIYINPASNLFRMNDIFIGDPSNPIVYSAQSFEFETTTNVSMFFSTNNTERMRIVGDGNIGIRTATPDTALKVNGSINVTGDVNYGGSLNSYSPLRFGKDKEKNYTTFCLWDANGNQTLMYYNNGVLITEPNSKYCKNYVEKDEQRRVIEKLPQIPSANDIANKTIMDIGMLE